MYFYNHTTGSVICLYNSGYFKEENQTCSSTDECKNQHNLMKKNPLWIRLPRKDKLLSYPYESMRPFLKLLQEAAEDKNVVSIKMTLYRGKQSKIIESLIEPLKMEKMSRS